MTRSARLSYLAPQEQPSRGLKKKKRRQGSPKQCDFFGGISLRLGDEEARLILSKEALF
jgi:hypothetical protein